MKKFKKFKRSFKRKGYKKRGKPTGYALKKSILTSTHSRCFEATLPLYIIASATASTGVAGFLAYPTLAPGTPFTSNIDILGLLNNYPEFLHMIQVWGLMRCKGISIKYYNILNPNSANGVSVITQGALSLSITNNQTAISLDALNRNYTYDGNLLCPTYAMKASRSKYWKFPTRAVQKATNAFIPNAWVLTGAANFNGSTYLNIGDPVSSATNPNWVTVANNTASLVGKILIKIFVDFSQPSVAVYP